MIKSIAPRKLRGLSNQAIEHSIEKLMGYDVSFDGRVMLIGPIEDYGTAQYIFSDCKHLESIGDVHVLGNKRGVFVEIILNPRAIEIITNADKKEEINNDCKNTVSGSESANC